MTAVRDRPTTKQSKKLNIGSSGSINQPGNRVRYFYGGIDRMIQQQQMLTVGKKIIYFQTNPGHVEKEAKFLDDD